MNQSALSRHTGGGGMEANSLVKGRCAEFYNSRTKCHIITLNAKLILSSLVNLLNNIVKES